ncbi:MAG: DUF4442 domain-containing protein [Bdellovibrionales bacterium]|nr:DUF4442 domain-containing protein [Bdellovibrionales bacterium]
MICWLRPRVVELNDYRCEIVIPLSRRSRNHLNSMYFGALCVGADCAGGLMAFEEMRKARKKIDLVFKSISGEFLKRPEGDVHFICEDGGKTQQLIERTINSKEREETPVTIIAKTYDPEELEVAKFTLTLSVKLREK